MGTGPFAAVAEVLAGCDAYDDDALGLAEGDSGETAFFPTAGCGCDWATAKDTSHIPSGASEANSPAGHQRSRSSPGHRAKPCGRGRRRTHAALPPMPAANCGTGQLQPPAAEKLKHGRVGHSFAGRLDGQFVGVTFPQQQTRAQRKPPNGRMVEEQRLHQPLHKVRPKVEPAAGCTSSSRLRPPARRAAFRRSKPPAAYTIGRQSPMSIASRMHSERQKRPAMLKARAARASRLAHAASSAETGNRRRDSRRTASTLIKQPSALRRNHAGQPSHDRIGLKRGGAAGEPFLAIKDPRSAEQLEVGVADVLETIRWADGGRDGDGRVGDGAGKPFSSGIRHCRSAPADCRRASRDGAATATGFGTREPAIRRT